MPSLRRGLLVFAALAATSAGAFHLFGGGRIPAASSQARCRNVASSANFEGARCKRLSQVSMYGPRISAGASGFLSKVSS